MYKQVSKNLKQSYDQNAQERDQYKMAKWKIEERQVFLELLQKEGKQRLLEIGAGTGRDSKFFQDNGLDVTCTDLSCKMVAMCRDKGLNAYTMDFLNLDFPDKSFDSLYALNCLLHVPKNELPHVLSSLQNMLQIGGIFYLGVYGGDTFEGIWEEDTYRPKRFFSFYTDEQIKQIVSEYFEILAFKVVDIGDLAGKRNDHFQSMTLKRIE